MENTRENLLEDLTFRVGDVSFRMIALQGGTFRMGASKVQDEMALADYYIGQTVVTQELWKTVMGTNPSLHQGKQFPVENVSWTEVLEEFLPKLNQMTGWNFTLPSEAQWEFAAREGRRRHYLKYSGSDAVRMLLQNRSILS